MDNCMAPLYKREHRSCRLLDSSSTLYIPWAPWTKIYWRCISPCLWLSSGKSWSAQSVQWRFPNEVYMSVVTVKELYVEQAIIVQVPNMQIWQAAPGLISNHLTDKSINSYKKVVGNPCMHQHLHFHLYSSSHVAHQVNRIVSAKSFTLCRSSTNIGFHRSISGWQWAPFCPWAIINRNIIFTKMVQSLGIPTSNRAISF